MARKQAKQAAAHKPAGRSARQATAGGRASSGGTKFHASVATYLFTSMLARTPVNWFGLTGRVPTAVSAESGGAGDDLQIEFGLGAVAEAQARRRMNAAGNFSDLVDAILARTTNKSAGPVALVAGRHDSSSKLFSDIARDLNGLRTQVDEERLSEPVAEMQRDKDKRRVLEALYVVDVDFDEVSSPDRENALEKLRRRLVDEKQAELAWSALYDEAVDMCAWGSRRDKEDLVATLEAKGIKLRASTVDEELNAQLDYIRTRMLEEHYLTLAEQELRRVLADADARAAGPETRAEAQRLLAHAVVGQGRFAEARDAAYRAVELNPGSADTHASFGRMLLELGDVDGAADAVDRSLAIDATSRRGWAFNLHVALRRGVDPGEPPAMLMADPLFRTELAGVRAQQRRWDDALELTETLLREPNPRPHVSYIHATAITSIATATEPPDEAGLRRAELELSALVNSMRHDHPLLPQIYYQRANVRRLLGLSQEADADEEQWRKVNRDDPEMVEQMAAIHVGRGDVPGALAILETSIVPASPSLLAMRAGLLAGVGRVDDARRDLQAAAAALPTAVDPDQTAWALGEVSIELGDLSLARSFYSLMSAPSQTGPMGLVLAGAIDFAETNADSGAEHFRAAIAAEGETSRADRLRIRLAMHLSDAGRPSDGLAVLREMAFDAVPNDALRVYIMVAFQAEDFVAAKRGLDRLATNGPLPRWALSVRANIGLRSDDPTAVITDLEAMIAGGEKAARVYLTLAIAFIELGEANRALEQARAALTLPLTPLERLEASVLLKRLDRPNEAVAQAFRAYREDRNDPQIQRTFASLVLTGGATLQAPVKVTAGSHVRLVRVDGAKRGHSIFGEPPVEKAAGELLADEAGEFLGRAIGDRIVRERKPLPDQVWTIDEIIPAEVHAAQTVIATFQDTFPNEQPFVTAVHVGNLEKPEDFTELLAMLGSRHEHAKKTLELYHERVLPLEFIANALGATVAELMEIGRTPASAPLLIEWASPVDYVAAVRQATEANTLVLTRSALYMARRERLLDELAPNYELVAPRSLERQMRDELRTTTEAAAQGASTLVSAPAGWNMVELEPNHPTLVAARDDADETLAWLLANVKLLPRPLEDLGSASGAGDIGREAIREQLGPPSFDASALVAHGQGTLYADDLGLRRYAVRGNGPVAGVSTVSLVDGLVERGALSAVDRGRVHANMVLAGCAYVPPSADLLLEAVHRMPALGAESFAAILATLGGPLAEPKLVAALVGEILRHAATQTLERVSIELVAEAVIRSLIQKWARPASIAVVRTIAARELRLLPRHLERVQRVCARIGAEEPPEVA